jgi:hypothetical protein
MKTKHRIGLHKNAWKYHIFRIFCVWHFHVAHSHPWYHILLTINKYKKLWIIYLYNCDICKPDSTILQAHFACLIFKNFCGRAPQTPRRISPLSGSGICLRQMHCNCLQQPPTFLEQPATPKLTESFPKFFNVQRHCMHCFILRQCAHAQSLAVGKTRTADRGPSKIIYYIQYWSSCI